MKLFGMHLKLWIRSGEEIELNLKLTNLTDEKQIKVIFSFFVGQRAFDSIAEEYERKEGTLYFTYLIDKSSFTKKISFSLYNYIS